MATRAPSEARRRLLKRGAFGAASLAAVAVAAGATTTSSAARPSTSGTTTMRLLGRGWHVDAKDGKLPTKGERYAVYGELVDGKGDTVGEFFSQNVGVDSPFHITGEGTGAFEIHTLSLPGGTIVGVGVGGGRERNYAIVGGTGKYTGARGSYLARQDTYGLGGDGKAEILLTLLD
ncbi:MAG: hypothetical protein E6J19_09130 [Chloroflexi bacterium]|nr:MAG: hypothetical protein E6J19_09130 [Chloroflexota bacterium]